MMPAGKDDRLQELERLCQELLSLRKEVERLAEENQDLRESARIWIRLYEGHLARPDRAPSALAGIAGERARDLDPSQ